MLHLDFETRSEVPLGGQKSVGVHNYACHPSTRALMLAWAFNDEPVQLWQPHAENMPGNLRKGLENPKQQLAAWNSTFERYIFQYVLNLGMPIERFVDPQASARYLSLPSSLDEVSIILGLPKELAKDADGKHLIDIFSQPTVPRKKKGQEAVVPYFRDHRSDPEDWAKFGEYCKRDVVAEREIQRRLTLLGAFPLPERERKIWVFDQKVNDRGMPVDVDFVKKALSLATRAKKEAIEKQNILTGLDNANSNTQMLAWARTQGYEQNSLRKEAVAAALKYSQELTPLCREAFEARKAASSTSYKKLAAILRQVSSDRRLRNQFIYMGSARCGRWSGNAVQLHNMARPEERFEDEETLNWARAMIYAEDYDSIVNWFGSVLLTIKSCIRTAFVAKPGHRFNVCDLNAIETRVSAWVAGCAGLLKVFEEGKDPYLDFATKMTQIPYENLAADIKSKDPAVKAAAKRHRQVAKPGVLGCVYRLGGGQMGKTKKGDPVKQGLWGYAENMGVDLTQETSHQIVKVFRGSYEEIPDFWVAIEKAIADVLELGTTNVKRQLGPGGCIKFDKIPIKDRHPVLRIQLPSGRYLHYVDARIESCKMPWEDSEGKEVYKKTLVYASTDQVTKQWGIVTAHGGKTFENIVQGIARDVLAESLLRFENEKDLPVCGHVHDEGISETEDDCFAPGVEDMQAVMSQTISWAPGLPLKADGFSGPYYHK